MSINLLEAMKTMKRISLLHILALTMLSFCYTNCGYSITKIYNTTDDNITNGGIAVVEPENEGLSFGPNLSTLGLGVDATYQFNSTLAGRIGISFVNMNIDLLSGTVALDKIKNFKARTFDINTSFKGLAVPVLLDIHPFNTGFRVSVGAVFNNFGLKAAAGNDSLELKFRNNVAPIFTIGYDGTFSSNDQFGFKVELGAMVINGLKAETNVSGISNIDLARFNDQVRENTSALKIWPIISAGMNIKL